MRGVELVTATMAAHRQGTQVHYVMDTFRQIPSRKQASCLSLPRQRHRWPLPARAPPRPQRLRRRRSSRRRERRERQGRQPWPLSAARAAMRRPQPVRAAKMPPKLNLNHHRRRLSRRWMPASHMPRRRLHSCPWLLCCRLQHQRLRPRHGHRPRRRRRAHRSATHVQHPRLRPRRHTRPALGWRLQCPRTLTPTSKGLAPAA